MQLETVSVIDQYKEREATISVKPGGTLRLENSAIEKVETGRPQFTRIQRALMQLGHIFLPQEKYFEKRLQTTYLLVSKDMLERLKAQIPQYYEDIKQYTNKLDTIKASRKVSPNDIVRAAKKRQPTIVQDLESQQFEEINTLNAKLLESPPRPALLGNDKNSPQVVVLENTEGIGVKLTLDETRHLAESKRQTGVAISVIPESIPLTFNGEVMNHEYTYTRGVDKNRHITISSETGTDLSLTGKGPNSLDLLLRNSR